MEIITAIIKAVGSFASPLLNSFGKRRERRIAAATEFRRAVLRELAGLYPLAADWPSYSVIENMLKRAFPALQAAVASCRPYVADAAAFDNAWLWYRSATKREVDVQCYLHYMTSTVTTLNAHGGETVVHEDGRANFKRNVDRLLNFALEV
jgi:hypothetical protein